MVDNRDLTVQHDYLQVEHKSAAHINFISGLVIMRMTPARLSPSKLSVHSASVRPPLQRDENSHGTLR